MHDLRFIRSNTEEFTAAMAKRNKTVDIDGILAADARRRELISQTEVLKNKRNQVSREIPRLKKAGQDVEKIMEEMREANARMGELDAQIKQLDAEIEDFLLSYPNIPHESVPEGFDESGNIEVRSFMQPTEFAFEPQPHWDVGTRLNILDFETAGKVTGSRFVFYRGLGARLERALINFFLDTHTRNGYTEIFPPFLAHRRSMTGTGQLPKFEEDMFRVEGTEYFLIPTAEVPVTNMHRDEILAGEKLPLHYCAYSANFRAEAGSAGRDTRGIIRNHQFNKVELVMFTKPEESFAALEALTAEAELILKELKLPYRVVELCAGDMGFSAAKAYDLEVWMPSYGRYVEISSCSNFGDFQARRANIRYREDAAQKPAFAHTLNGSGLAVGRTVAAILENYQNADGSVTIPEALRTYMGCDIINAQD